MKRMMVAVIVLLALLPLSGARAQEGDACDIAALKARLGEAIQQAETLDDLNRLSTEIATSLARCEPKPEVEATYSFEGTGNGIVGPLELTQGLYVVDYTSGSTSDPYSNLDLSLEHKTDHFSVTVGAWRPLAGRSLMRVGGGMYFINVESVSNWSFTITPFDPEVQTDVLAFAADTVEDLWGPFELKEGYYLLGYTNTNDPNGWSGHFYIHLLDARDLDYVEGLSVHGIEQTIEGEKVIYVEEGIYLFEIDADASLDWSVQLVPVE